MITLLEQRIDAFAFLGNVLGKASAYLQYKNTNFAEEYTNFVSAIEKTSLENPWFTMPDIAIAMSAWSDVLTKDNIQQWIQPYQPDIEKNAGKKVAVIMAGNIPLVGFHDFMCVLVTGHKFIGKLSSQDKYILPALAEILCKFDPSLNSHISFTNDTLQAFDAIIATGSNNSARYFEQYFSHYPHVIRKSRNSIAILSGNETKDEMNKLGNDICMYFGLGCRSVSKVYVPAGFDIIKLFEAIEPYTQTLVNHSKYMNNYMYNKSIMLVNQTFHYENAVMLIQESQKIASPISVLFYETYENLHLLKEFINQNDTLLQCTATNIYVNGKTVKLGETQFPKLQNYADGIDTLDFLNNF